MQAFDVPGVYVRMLLEIFKGIRWFLFIILISILASWNAFILLFKEYDSCPASEGGGDCKAPLPRDVISMIRGMYNTVNAVVFQDSESNLLESADHYGIAVAIHIFSMIVIPIIMINMLIAIMGDNYEKIKVCFLFHSHRR
jgi:hypothetical protein